jgi:hypothetical protein
VITMNNDIKENNIAIKHSQEETLAWSRLIRFEWTAPDADAPELVVIKLYHSDFDGYEIDWFACDCSQAFKDAVVNENDLCELLDQLTWDFKN